MARRFARKCPKCHDYFGVTIGRPSRRRSEFLVYGFCGLCGYRLSGWRLLLGGKPAPLIRYERYPKVFR
jgi:hypothetical protein